MPLSYVIHTGNGATTNFNVPFQYLDKSHVGVKVNGSVVSFTWVNTSTVQVTPAPANLATVEVRRTTPTAPLVTYNDGSTLLGADLNNSNKQVSFIAEEAADSVTDTVSLDSQDRMDAKNKRIANVAAPVDATDAANRQFVIDQTASSVSAAAASANSAQSAQTAAELARDQAQTAETNAETAQSGAETAKTAAELARDLAIAAAGSLTPPVAVNLGGTGATTAAGARTNLGLGALATKASVATADIDNNSVSLAKLSRSGTAGQLLTSNGPGADPSYQDAPAGAPAFLLLNAGII